MQAAERRQPDATPTPPSLPASGWRRDFLPDMTSEGGADGSSPCVAPGDAAAMLRRLNPIDFPDPSGVSVEPDARGGHPPGRRVAPPPAAVMILAPVLGALLILAAALALG